MSGTNIHSEQREIHYTDLVYIIRYLYFCVCLWFFLQKKLGLDMLTDLYETQHYLNYKPIACTVV